jgi:hypothetical protein
LQKLGRLALIAVVTTGVIAENASPVFAKDAPKKVKLEAGTVLELTLKTAVSSESSKVGDRVEFELDAPIMVGDVTVLPNGSLVTGHGAEVRRAGKRNCKDGTVTWKMDAIKATDGSKVQLIPLFGRPYAWDGSIRKVHVKTAGEKLEKGTEDVALAPILAVGFVWFLPLIVILTVGLREPCHARAGVPKSVPDATAAWAFVAHDVKIRVTNSH